MAEQRIFEARLADAFERFLEGAPSQTDAVTLTASLASARPTRRFGLPSLAGLRGQQRWALTVLVLLLLALVTTILLVGRQLEVPIPVQPYRGIFAPVGSMATLRQDPVMVSLADGRVLIAGGRVGAPIPAELFDPATGTSERIAEGPTGSGTGILLPDGRVLSILYDSNATSSWAYLFDPVASAFEQLEQPGFSNAPAFGVEPSLATLDDGRVLISGGLADVYRREVLASALIFDPATDTFTPTGSMVEERRYHAVATMLDGRVLVAAGEAREGLATDDDVGSHLAHRSWLGTAEVYDPQAGTFSLIGALPTVHGAAVARVLPDGRVWILPHADDHDEYWVNAGQAPAYPTGESVATDIFDPAPGSFSPGPTLPGTVATVSLLRDGRLLVTGELADGVDDFGTVWAPWARIYDVAAGTIEDAPTPSRRLATEVVLGDGRVLFAGGLLEDYQQGGTAWLETFE